MVYFMYSLHVKKKKLYHLPFYESGILDSVLNKFHFPSWKLPTTFSCSVLWEAEVYGLN